MCVKFRQIKIPLVHSLDKSTASHNCQYTKTHSTWAGVFGLSSIWWPFCLLSHWHWVQSWPEGSWTSIKLYTVCTNTQQPGTALSDEGETTLSSSTVNPEVLQELEQPSQWGGRNNTALVDNESTNYLQYREQPSRMRGVRRHCPRRQ